jgi:TetR/AcrR family transcriptional regulator, transcriptional repressor for nem operon
MMVNAHARPESTDPQVRRRLDRHHDRLRSALRAALDTARRHDQLRRETDPEAAAAHLALLAYGVNLRSRAGASATSLTRTVTGVLTALTDTEEPPTHG